MTGKKPALTRNQSLVLDHLIQAGEPLTAYTLLDRLREAGLRAPVQIYRALEPLLNKGLVHRLESLNAYIACAHSHAHPGTTIFSICGDCGEVGEYTDDGLEARISDRIAAGKFKMISTMVEIRGICAQCAESQVPS